MVVELKLQVEVAEPPAVNVTLVGLQEAVRPVAGLTDCGNVSVPVKPLRLVSMMLDVAEEPTEKVTAEGPALILKSMMLTVIWTECGTEPLEPMTVTV